MINQRTKVTLLKASIVLAVAATLVLAECSSTLEPGPKDITDPAPRHKPISFYGHVTDPVHAPIAGARIEFECGICGECGPAFTGDDGDYVLYGPNHEGHRGIIFCGAPGYLGVGIALDVCGPAPERHDFVLIPDQRARRVRQLGSARVIGCAEVTR